MSFPVLFPAISRAKPFILLSPSPLLSIRFVEGEVTIKFRIGGVMRVLFNRFVEGKVTIHFPLFCEVKSIISLLA